MKTKKVLLLATLLLSLIILMAMAPTKLFAAIPAGMSEEFKAILNENGELVITDTSEFNSKDVLVTEYLSRYSNENYYFTNSYPTDENYTSCIIERYEIDTGNLLESYEISIKYEEKYSDEFKKILDENGNIMITNSSLEGMTDLIWFHCELASTKSLRFNPIYNEDWNGTTCTIQMLEMYDDYTSQMVEQHVVNIIKEEKYSEEFKKLVDENGNLVITNSSYNGIIELIECQCNLMSTKNLRFSPFLNDDWNGTSCTIVLNKVDEYYNYQPIEKHVVNIIEEEKFGNEFKKILNDENKIVITDSVQGDKFDLIENYCNKFSTDNIEFDVISINEDRTECTVGLYNKIQEQYGYSMDIIEQHIIKISYEEKYSDEFKKVLNAGDKILITTSSLGEKRELINDYVSQFSTKDLIYNCYEANEDGTVCTISIFENNMQNIVIEQHVVNVIYEEKYSNEFKKYLNKNGNIVIKSSRDYGKEELLGYFCSTISEPYGVQFDFSNVNDDATACTLRIITQGETYNQVILEQHIVKIEYDKKMSEDFKNILNKDGKFVFNSVKPTTEEEWWSLSEVLLMSLKEKPWFVSYEEEDLSALDLTIIDSKGYPETHRVEVVFNYDKNNKKIADELLKKIQENDVFKVKDLELLNYWLNGGENETEGGAGKFDNYSGELKALVENKNFNIIVDHRMGAGEDFSTMRGGIALLQYNGETLGIRYCIEIRGDHIIYVPDDTPTTKEALLAAVQKRVDEYAGKGKVKISAGEGTILEFYEKNNAKTKKELQDKLAAEKAKERPNKMLINEYEWQIEMCDDYYEYFLASYNDPESENYFLKSAEGGYWFVATIDGIDYEFIVVKDSSKMLTPTYKSADMVTNVEISSTSTTVPLDTTIEAERLTTGEEYNKIMDILNVKENETFDLKLYSNSLEKYITKLEDGTFEVRIPLPDKFKGKTDLWVYYVDENGKVQDYEVEISKDGYAIFTTDHFSIYTLSEKRETTNDGVADKPIEENNANTNNNTNSNKNKENNGTNVKTGDDIMLYVFMFIISVIGLVTIKKLKK